MTLTAQFDGTVLVPNGPVDLPRDVPLRITVEVVDSTVEGPGAARNDRPLRKYARMARPTGLPNDFSTQHDHYIHGTSKR